MKALDFLMSDSTQKQAQPSQAAQFLNEQPPIPNELATARPTDMAAAHQAQGQSDVQRALGQAAAATRPIIEGGGAMVGGAVGAASPVPGGAFMGGTGGYAIGKKIADILEQWTGNKVPEPIMQEIIGSLGDVKQGAEYEMGGQIAGPILSGASKAVGKVAEPLLGRLSGAGIGAVKEAVKGSPDFTSAMRGNITGEEIVANARESLNVLKARRGAEYQKQLEAISQNQTDLDITPIVNKTANLMKQYGVKVNPDGTLDASRIAMGKAGRDDIVDVIDNISKWGSQPGDRTAIGLDTLKRQLDDFYSESSQARAFVADLRNTIRGVITKEVPEYGKMTAGYSEATKLIKDLETGLMTRKNAMTGRVTADMTLRRLMSAMRDNFALRGELLEVLGEQGGQDLPGQVAGYTMNSLMPRGLAGTGPALVGQAAFATFNPKFWPVLAASSPRVQGEFLRYWGKATQQAQKIPASAIKEGARQALIATDNE